MARDINKKAVLIMWVCFAMLVLSQNTVTLVASRSLQELGEQKNYYSPDPHVGSSPKHSLKKPSCATPSGGSSHGKAPSSHGSGSKGHGTTPSHGSGGSYGTPPSHGSGGGFYSPPSGGSPAVITPPPSPVVVDPVTPTPTVPLVPTTPDTPYFTGTCDYWKTHPALIWGAVGYWGTVGGTFGVPTDPVFFNKKLSIMEALLNTRTDGFGALYREGTASLLNAMVNKEFFFSTKHVKEAFVAALASEKTAAGQAQIFKQANEGHLKH